MRHLRSRDAGAAPILGRLVVLGLPTFGMALAITGVATYAPVVARGFGASALAIGLIIAVEGLLGLWLPLLVGDGSDRLRTRLGGRLPFVLVATPAMAVCLVAIGLADSALVLGVFVAGFFAAYFVAYEPYRALYPDLVPDEVAGRSQSVQAAFRGLGTIAALAGGGALLAVAAVLPFAVFAFVLALSVAVFVLLLLRSGYRRRIAADHASAQAPPPRRVFGRVAELLRGDPALRSFVLANSLWELSLAALKTFVVLYVTVGLGYSLGSASLLIAAVAVFVLAGAIGSGVVGDRVGRARVAEGALWVYGFALLVPGVLAVPAAVAIAAPFVAIGGGVLMSLPYSLLMPLMPPSEHGVLTGLYGLSRGVGIALGPLLAGLAIELTAPLLTATDGYQATWLVCSVAILASIPVLRAMRRSTAARR